MPRVGASVRPPPRTPRTPPAASADSPRNTSAPSYDLGVSEGCQDLPQIVTSPTTDFGSPCLLVQDARGCDCWPQGSSDRACGRPRDRPQRPGPTCSYLSLPAGRSAQHHGAPEI